MIASTLIGVGGPVMGVAIVLLAAVVVSRVLRKEGEWLAAEEERRASAELYPASRKVDVSPRRVA